MSRRDVTDAELAELRSLAARLLAKVDKIITERSGDNPVVAPPRKTSPEEVRKHAPHILFMRKRRALRKGDQAALEQVRRDEQRWGVVARHKDHGDQSQKILDRVQQKGSKKP